MITNILTSDGSTFVSVLFSINWKIIIERFFYTLQVSKLTLLMHVFNFGNNMFGSYIAIRIYIISQIKESD